MVAKDYMAKDGLVCKMEAVFIRNLEEFLADYTSYRRNNLSEWH
jgi:hypothetical protein